MFMFNSSKTYKKIKYKKTHSNFTSPIFCMYKMVGRVIKIIELGEANRICLTPNTVEFMVICRQGIRKHNSATTRGVFLNRFP